MKKKTIFTGAGVAIITPMQADGTVDHALLTRLVDEQIQGGTDAIVICGTTGEAATLTDEEHIATIGTAVKAAAGRVPVVAGTGANDTAHSLRLATAARDLGADALLLVTPYYNKTNEEGMYLHFKTVADAVKIPCILYNVPGRTGCSISVANVARLSQHPNIVGIKEASGNMSYAAKVAKYLSDDFAMYSGNDDMIVPLLSIGASGVISVLANIAPKETHQMVFDYLEGRTDDARHAQIELLDVINDLFIEVNPVPVKEAMNLLGMDVGGYRLPLTHMTEAHRETLRSSLAAAGFLK